MPEMPESLDPLSPEWRKFMAELEHYQARRLYEELTQPNPLLEHFERNTPPRPKPSVWRRFLCYSGLATLAARLPQAWRVLRHGED